MSDLPEDPILTAALRSLPVPTLSEDFDIRVLAALRQPRPWCEKLFWWPGLFWRRVWQPVQPLLLGTSCSLGLTLLLLHFALSGPISAPTPAPAAAVSNLASAPPAPQPALDALLDRPNLRAGSLAAWNRGPLAEDQATEPEKTPRPEPRRRAEVYSRPVLVA